VDETNWGLAPQRRLGFSIYSLTVVSTSIPCKRPKARSIIRLSGGGLRRATGPTLAPQTPEFLIDSLTVVAKSVFFCRRPKSHGLDRCEIISCTFGDGRRGLMAGANLLLEPNLLPVEVLPRHRMVLLHASRCQSSRVARFVPVGATTVLAISFQMANGLPQSYQHPASPLPMKEGRYQCSLRATVLLGFHF
jgi:hypothetical protein